MEMPLKGMGARLTLWRTRIQAVAARRQKSAPQTGLDHRRRIEGLFAKCVIGRSELSKVKTARS